MTKISRQLGKYFVLISMLSIAFITIISNIGINLFFSDYVRNTRSRDDLKVVQYIEQVYGDYGELNSQSLMSIMHYTFSEAVTVQIRDLKNDLVWSSGTSGAMNNMMGGINGSISHQIFRNYPFSYKGTRVGSIDVGRPKSVISSVEDKQFLRTINCVLALAFLFSIIIAVLSSTNISRTFLKPILLIKENAKLIEDGKYKKLREINTNTYELYELSVSVKELAERLDFQDSLRRRMTSDIAHELRTPLATIQSHIEAFMDGVWQPDQEKLSIIYDEITRLTKLIKDLSDLSIAENEDIKLYKKEVNLSELVYNVVESFEPLLISKNINIIREIQHNVMFFGDPDRLSQIFINIISNAYKYSNENGSIYLVLKKLKDVVRITVKDTGIGISNEDLRHVFERFYRSDLSRNRGTGGTGIGLTITRALVEAHGGIIGIESKVGEGTMVYIEFKMEQSS